MKPTAEEKIQFEGWDKTINLSFHGIFGLPKFQPTEEK